MRWLAVFLVPCIVCELSRVLVHLYSLSYYLGYLACDDGRRPHQMPRTKYYADIGTVVIVRTTTATTTTIRTTTSRDLNQSPLIAMCTRQNTFLVGKHGTVVRLGAKTLLPTECICIRTLDLSFTDDEILLLPTLVSIEVFSVVPTFQGPRKSFWGHIERLVPSQPRSPNPRLANIPCSCRSTTTAPPESLTPRVKAESRTLARRGCMQ